MNELQARLSEIEQQLHAHAESERRVRKRRRVLLLLLALTATASVAAGQVTTLPHSFSPGTPAKASEINTNFQRVRDYTVPAGGIIMWSGAVVPAGWKLCDGSSGTPNLRDKFVVGSGLSYAVGATGGAVSVSLATTNLPSHRHSITTEPNHTHQMYFDVFGGGSLGSGFTISGTDAGNFTLDQSMTSQPGGSHSHGGFTGFTGSAAAHENRPPYYALAFIMKE